ncbi:Erg28-like protein [Tilletiopsis washingtonensis]|uniref:Erg28-like protein n=1 Tax=Tilletiopsis washingtonensis TaxID=58919 RepID=A0A316ZCC3_9BASI|nr:Erg28-like protein [Tilletiopsis washingtonensis]PWN98688.1 Erg28-like protein [Tilletiopsis washingtonensis]
MSFLPVGLLPKWLLLVSSLAVFNCVQNYVDHAFARRVYTRGGAQVTPLSARTFGVWNLASAGVRLYAAYNIHNRQVYELCALTYVLALAHFSSEVFVYKTASIRAPGVISPLIVASSSLAAMLLQHQHYVALSSPLGGMC